jgi:NAD(P)-dependent dehydrogenase (short-subunit alcohol dehydrogenase family)
LDVASTNNFQDVFDFCIETFGSVDVVVNNAGINGENNWETMLDINLKVCMSSAVFITEIGTFDVTFVGSRERH